MKKFEFGFLLIIFMMKSGKTVIVLDQPETSYVVLSMVDCQRWNSNGRKLSRSGNYYSDEAEGGKTVEASSLPKMERQAMKSSSKGGIGAWGYVSIILFVILTGLGVYYTIIFYPIICKKQRMYHVMGLTTV